MKKVLVILMVLALVLVTASSAFAARPDHPKGPESMPEQALGGLHTAVFNTPGENPPVDSPKAYHVVRGLMLLTDVEAPHAPCD